MSDCIWSSSGYGETGRERRVCTAQRRPRWVCSWPHCLENDSVREKMVCVCVCVCVCVYVCVCCVPSRVMAEWGERPGTRGPSVSKLFLKRIVST